MRTPLGVQLLSTVASCHAICYPRHSFPQSPVAPGAAGPCCHSYVYTHPRVIDRTTLFERIHGISLPCIAAGLPSLPRRVRQGSGGLGMGEWTRPTAWVASSSMRSRGILAPAALLKHSQVAPSLLQHSCHCLRALASSLLVLSRRVGAHRLCTAFGRTRNRA